MRVWTKDSLEQIVEQRMRGFKFIAVSNREPYIHEHVDGRIECSQPASGLTSAMDPIMRASGGTWVAHGSGTADRHVVDASDHVCVPPEKPAYRLRRVWIPADVETEYYYGLANEGLWPLCHVVFHRPHFSRRHWESYQRANQLFADAVLEEAHGKPAFVFIQDYHFGLLPGILRRANPELRIAQFWHIPWPNSETFRTFPWKQELLEGLLGNDLLGFQLPHHCENFLDSIRRNLDAVVDPDRAYVTHKERLTSVRAFPISIDFEQYERMASSPDILQGRAVWKALIGYMPEILGIGIDRIDYTKGIPERLQALDLLFADHPEYRGKLTFVQVGVPSRTAISDYQQLNDSVAEQIGAINSKWARGSWKPLVFIHHQVDQKGLIALCSMANFCVVSSLHDGMNLVAKEFAASRIDQKGVLVLSAFTGAAQQLKQALIVNPFATEEMATAIHAAINMPLAEQRRRMTKIRSAIAVNNIYSWAARVVLALSATRVALKKGAARNAAIRSVILGAA
jgi:trehalose-6-phosphate synthase